MKIRAIFISFWNNIEKISQLGILLVAIIGSFFAFSELRILNNQLSEQIISNSPELVFGRYPCPEYLASNVKVPTHTTGYELYLKNAGSSTLSYYFSLESKSLLFKSNTTGTMCDEYRKSCEFGKMIVNDEGEYALISIPPNGEDTIGYRILVPANTSNASFTIRIFEPSSFGEPSGFVESEFICRYEESYKSGNLTYLYLIPPIGQEYKQ